MTGNLCFQVKASQLTGHREFQNDSYYVGKRWLVVADGAGSHPAVRDVSDHVVEHYGDLAQSAPSHLMADALASAPEKLAASLARAGIEDASTVVVAVLDDAGQLWLSSVGDSRLLVLRDGQIIAMNSLHNQRAAFLRDHPDGVPPYGSDGMLTRFIAAGENYSADTISLEPRADDVVLLLSDGVEGALDLDQIRSAVQAAGPDPDAINSAIMSTASKKGLADNATCVVGRITQGELP